MRRIIVASAIILALAGAAYALSIEIAVRKQGFANWFERRAAHASGILSAEEWRAMRSAGDRSEPASGGEGCESAACRSAEELIGGRWRVGADCAVGSRYHFTDGAAVIEDIANDAAMGSIRRRYRIVSAPVGIPIRADAANRPLDLLIEKKPGDLEVWTLGASSYVRRIFRPIDPDTIMLVLVQNRIGRDGPVQTLYADGRSTVDGAEGVYRRCAA